MTKKEQIEKMRRALSIKTGMIEDLHELIGAEHQRAETFKKEADVWKDKAARLEQKLKRQQTPILQGGKKDAADPVDELKEMIRQLTTDVRMMEGMINRANGTTTTMISGYVDRRGTSASGDVQAGGDGKEAAGAED